MPSYLRPGVFVEEVPSGSKPIEGVATSTVAFIGVTQRNSTHEPVLIGSVTEYMEFFGPIFSSSDVIGLAIQAYYSNGGGKAYVCPLSIASDTANKTFADLTVTANGDGPWGNLLHIRITRVSASDFDIEVGTRNSAGSFYSLEAYEKVSLNSMLNNAETMINDVSSYITVAVTGVTLPALTNDDGVALENGAQTSPTAPDYKSFYKTTLCKIREVSIIVLPGQTWAADGSGNAIISETLAHCESMKNRVLIIDPSETTKLSSAGEVAKMALPTSSYTAIYYPWVSVANPVHYLDRNPSVSSTINIAPSAIAAGMWAKIDAERGVWKAPAGVEAQLIGASSLKFQVESLEQDQLNPLGINCIRNMPNFGLVFWGARTLATKAEPEWRYIPVRRTEIYIKESIYKGIQWCVFEPNDYRLWSSLQANIGAFMNGLFRAGALQGQKASDAYFVRCGLNDTMTQAEIDAGQVIVMVGFAPLKPAEFVIVRIQQKVKQQ